MQYNYDFEIASVVVLAIILLHFIFIRQFPTNKTKVFGVLLMVCIGEAVMNILSCVSLANAELVPIFWNKFLVFAFFALEGLSAYLIFQYMLVVCELDGRKKRTAMLFGLLPFLLFEVMLVLTPWLSFFFYFENNQYVQGVGADFEYWYIMYYFSLNLVLIFLRRNIIDKRTKTMILIYTVTAITAIVTQFCFREILLTSTGNMVILLMAYLTMQNPGELLDTVTGVGNESAFIMQIKRMQSRQEEHAVVTVYLRQFHHIITLLGYENSNRILNDVGQYLLRIGGKYHVFHNSGDSFTVIADSRESAKNLLQQIKKRFSQDWSIQENEIGLNTAVFVQYYPTDFKTSAEYRGMWEYLMEQAKREGNQTVFETNATFIERYHRRNMVEMAVRRAILNKSFEVYYQPIYSLKEKRIVSLEALVRLHDEKLGFIPPDEFIPLAEKDGSIIHIGEQVLEASCRFLSKHVLSNPSLGIKTIHVNVSAAQCMRRNLKETMIPVLERYHIPPSMINLEVTERTAISTPKLMLHHMRELGKLGITFSMDDYGSGNSNCNYLIRFPFHEIKLDKDIVWASFEKEPAKIVLDSEIKTIQKLGIPLIAEGIENREQSEEMERLGVDCIQGYYYGRPMSEMDCLRYIRSFHSSSEEYGRT